MASPTAPVEELLAEGTRIYILARVVRLLPLDGGRMSVVARIDNPDENGFQQVAAPIERVFLTTVPQTPLPPEPPSLDRLTGRINARL